MYTFGSVDPNENSFNRIHVLEFSGLQAAACSILSFGSRREVNENTQATLSIPVNTDHLGKGGQDHGRFVARCLLVHAAVQVLSIPLRLAQFSGPQINSNSPAKAAAGSDRLIVTVNGFGFNQSMLVRWNGEDRTTSFVNGQLTAILTSDDLARPGVRLFVDR